MGVLLLVLLIACLFVHGAAIACNEFDPNLITLVTFDVFAALMDTPSSLISNVAKILPSLPHWEVESLVDTWLNDYGSYAGTVFDEAVTGSSPFQWMLRSSLDDINADMDLNLTSAEYEALIASWGQLTPWAGTKEVLRRLSAETKIMLAPLSNGDAGTLKSAMEVFLPEVNMTEHFVFSSDFPVGSFKPDARMYAQVPENDNGVAIQQELHVAGAPTDAWGSRDYGLFTALVYKSPTGGPNYPCFVLNNITDLLTIFNL
jgi:FMN phosphatase YigB (HAD superfamily)